MAEVFTINNVRYEVYPTKLVIRKGTSLPIQIAYTSLIDYTGDDSIQNYYFTRFMFRFVHQLDDESGYPYRIRLFDVNETDDMFNYNFNEERPILDEAISEELYTAINNILTPFAEQFTITFNNNNNNNNHLPIANYPNNGRRMNRIVPANASNTLTYANISDGTNMVNFQGEFGHGRYYRKNTFNQIQPHEYSGKKKNPFTQQNIEPGNITRYTARKPAAGGRRRKTMKRRRVNKKKTQHRRR